jgi:hypothetical protein
MDYLTYRNNALQALTLLSSKERKAIPVMTRDDLERWIKSEYNRHYGKVRTA